LRSHHVWLDNGKPVLFVDLENAVHPPQVDLKGRLVVAEWCRPVIPTRGERLDLDLQPVAELHQSLHLFSGGWEDDGDRPRHVVAQVRPDEIGQHFKSIRI